MSEYYANKLSDLQLELRTIRSAMSWNNTHPDKDKPFTPTWHSLRALSRREKILLEEVKYFQDLKDAADGVLDHAMDGMGDW